MNVVLIGPTGSGKTTLGRVLSDVLSLPLISTGDIARRLSDQDAATKLALKQGALAPEAAMRHEVKTAIEAADAESGGWILDGFPRTLAQGVCLMQWTSGMPLYVEVTVPFLTCIERLVERGREDDNPDAVARRLETYLQETRPLLKVLSSGGALFHLNGTMPTVAQSDRIVEAMR